MKRLTFAILLAFTLTTGNAQFADPLRTKDYKEQLFWIDSVYNSLSTREKVAQLFMVQAYSDKGRAHEEKIETLIRDYNIGGIIFSTGGPVRQAMITNRFQDLAKTKMLIALDAEWGLSMRLDSTFAYPYNMTLGAISDEDLIEQVGFRIGQHNKRLGVHINFSPVADINTNPENPIIGNRSFGEEPRNVGLKATMMMLGMQEAGLLTSAKHFPGHGDTDSDSHKTLPTVGFSEERINSVELYPFREMIANGLSGVMVAHLNVPALEQEEGLPSSLSSSIVSGLLKGRMGFNGLIYTDALGMRGAADYAPPGEVDLKAFLAGNDVLLMSSDPVKGIERITRAYEEGEVTEARLAYSVRKILKAKYWAGLHEYSPVPLENLREDLNHHEDRLLIEEVASQAITVVKNEENSIPVRDLDTRNVAYVPLGDDTGVPFLEALKKYTRVDEVKGDDLAGTLELLEPYNTVIIGHHRSSETPWKDNSFSDLEKNWLYEIAREKNVILSVFTSPYALLDLSSLTNIESILIAYQNEAVFQEKAAEIIFGAREAKGVLPVMAHAELPEDTGIETRSLSRLGYSLPEAVGMNSGRLEAIDSVIKRAISSGVTPGAQILVARRGKVVYNKSFGKHYYGADAEQVADTNLYDLASLTKILSTLPVIMQMVENERLSLYSTFGELLPELRNSNKGDLRLIETLSHYAGFKPWIPFYTYTLNEVTKKPSDKYYAAEPRGRFRVKVSDEMYLRSDYRDSIIKQIKDSELLPFRAYRYSDLPYFLLQRYIEKEYDQSLDEVAQKRFYSSLGMNYTTFKPLEKFRKGQIIPTEVDDYFRYQTVQGYVHDMAAAMLGGVGGHAGLFSNANDVAKIMQMYLQKGYYGGVRYFTAETLDKFNTCYFCEQDVRRGVGFDKPQLGDTGPTCGCVSMTSFGHSGFTGTYAWADPAMEIVYIFLSNRTYPSSENRKLITEGTRTVIQEIIYDAVMY
ncbi:glycoside hydrolase family 3 N-terminal domain-containing protein [Robertkochia aurantiaca]|uniref:glycoside hydrolase family 3 N-terminal domain-containing protein n=1 Tax=Robertkochia aurantiaca TaxID=2873700 RepID=UPI001CCE8B82|nr:glycoside hydrolase family 3 N-terminal domain-containing protein [Robertkochia sp. 3YJGBD-33]